MYDHSMFVSTVTALSDRALGSYDVDTFLAEALDRLVAVFGLDGCRLTLVLGEEQRLDAGAGRPGEPGVPGHAQVSLAAAGEPVGTLDAWTRADRTWTDQDRQAVQAVGGLVTAYAVLATRLRQQVRLAEQLQTALESRTVIEQAKGIVAARDGVTVEAAFELIRRHARTRHVTVHAVAEAVVNLGLQV